MCVSKSSGPVLISGDGIIASCSICLSSPRYCYFGKSSATSHFSGSPVIPVPLLLNMVYPVDVLVPLVSLLVHLFHVFLIVRFLNLIQMSFDYPLIFQFDSV